MCPLTSIKGWRTLHLPTFERFSFPHPLEAFTVLPFNPPSVRLSPLSAIRVSLLECGGEELCMLPVSLTLELSSYLNIGSGQVSTQVSKVLTATCGG